MSGQHREAGRAPGLIGLCQGRRIEIGADESLRWRSLLDLSNQRMVTVAMLFLDRADEAARWRRRLGACLDAREGMSTLGGGNLLALIGFDFLQDV